MGADHRERDLPPYAEGQIRIKSSSLVGRYGFTQSDRPDVEQQLRLEVWRRLPRYDSKKGSLKCFVYWLVEKAAATIIEHRTAEKRHCRRKACSVDAMIDDQEGGLVTLSEAGGECEADRRLGVVRGHFTDRSDLISEVRDFLAHLPADLCDLCRRLLEGQSFTDISRRTGIPRATLYERRDELCRLMEAAGLRKYHPSSAASPRPPVGNQ